MTSSNAVMAGALLSLLACTDTTAVVGKFNDDHPGRVPIVTRPATDAAPEASTNSAMAGSTAIPSAADGGETDACAQADCAAEDGGAPPSVAEPNASRQVTPQIAIEGGTRDEFCNGHGPVLQLVNPGAGTSECNGGITRRLFSYALCACHNLSLEGAAFTLDAFDSRQGPYVSGESGAAVGVNNLFQPAGKNNELRGSLIIAGREPLAVMNGLSVVGDLETNAEFQVGSQLQVGRDVWADADLKLADGGMFSVGRDLIQTPGRFADPALMVGGVRRERAIEVQPPCACEPASQLQISALVKQAQLDNDNAEAKVANDTFQALLLTDAAELACGRLALQGVSINVSTIAISVPKRTALFIDGDFVINTLATVAVDPGASGELDILISGNLVVQGSAFLGSTSRPSALRLYVAGQVDLGANIQLAGQLYAPNAQLALPGLTDSYGAFVANDIHTYGMQHLHYDRAITEASDCSAPPSACDDCDQCPGGLACMNGSCSPCQRDADCCAPATCDAGKCRAP